MRTSSLLAVLALSTAACTVSTDGAPCSTPGATTDCPGGQACGANLRCSARAAATGCIACPPGQTRCQTDPQACMATSDGVCSAWTTSATCGSGQVCVEGPASCRDLYSVRITSPGDGSIVPKAIPVAVTVTMASASTPLPTSVSLLYGGQVVLPLSPAGTSGLVATYAGTWNYPGSDGDVVQLSAQSVSGSGTAVSPAVNVTVDELAPSVSAAVTCSPASCPRDGTLSVSATASDAHLSGVSVTLDLDGGARSVALSNGGSGNAYQATLDLKQWPFLYFQHSTVATIVAVDAAGNAAQVTVPTLVSRLRWSYSAGAPVTSPAVLADGTLVVGVAATANQLRAVTGDGTEVWRATLGSAGVPEAPSAGAYVWAGSDDGDLYAVTPSGTLLGPCSGGAAGHVFTPAVIPGAVEAALAGNANGEVIGAKTSGAPPTCNLTGTAMPVSAATLFSGGLLTVPEATTSGSLVPFTSAPSNPIVLTQNPGGPLTSPPQVPLALTGSGKVLAATTDGNLYLSDPTAASTSTASIFSLPSAFATASPVVATSGDLFVSGSDKRIHRVTVPASGASVDLWASAPTLSGMPGGLALVTADASGVFLVATVSTTVAGQVMAFAQVGGLPVAVWPASGEPSEPFGPLSFPVVVPATSPSALATLYAGSSDGHLYAVVVDSPPDTASPWPKTYHDLANTENASSPLP